MPNLTHDFGVSNTEKLKRSTWLTNLRTKTAVKQGALIPLVWYDIIPNSTIEADNIESMIRLALTPLHPFFSDMYFTYGAYFVPYRVLYRNYPNMFGNGKPSEWSTPQEYVMPMGTLDLNGTHTTTSAGAGYDAVVNTSVVSGSTGAILPKVGNLADYLGLPLAIESGSAVFNVNIAPFLVYERIWTDYWRDENFQNPDPDLEKAEVFASGNTNISTCRFCLHYANKFHDYLTSLLPNVCKGTVPEANLPLQAFSTMSKLNGAVKLGTGSGGTTILNGSVWSQSAGVGVSTASGSNTNYITGTNLGVSVNPVALRNAFALLRASERNARTGSRAMNEAMRGIFEAKAPAVLDKAEFLGGNTIRLNLMSVPQTGENAGTLGAFSSTNAQTGAFKKTFDEPGIVMFVGTIRQKHDYPQAVDRYWRKSRRYHFFDPALAHISEQPIMKSELSVIHDDSNDDVIGFQEAWSEYEKPVSHITGYLRDESQDDMKAWCPEHYFSSGESFSAGTWYPEDGSEIAKACINYNSNMDSFQFLVDFNAPLKITAPKPICIPGLIDHIIA